jgi:hypothetical protein
VVRPLVRAATVSIWVGGDEQRPRSGPARIVARVVRDRLEQPSIRIAEEKADADPVVPLPVVPPLGVETFCDCRALLRRDAHGRVRAWAVRFVKGEPGRAQVSHDGMALLREDARFEDALVERRRLVGVLGFDGDVVDPGHLVAAFPDAVSFTTAVADDWRLAVTPSEETDPPSVLSWVLEHELEEEARERLGRRLAVEVGAGEAAVFFYGDSEEQVRAAEKLVTDILAERGLDARLEVSRWHPLEERWEDASVPLPRTAAERQAELARLEAEEVSESRQEGPQWEVRLELPGHGETAALADRLEREGIPVLRRWKFLLIGAESERQANELADRLRREAPAGTIVSVEGSGELLDEVAFPNPFVVFGGLGT